MTISGILDKVRELLRGEPARAIGYGAAAIIYLVAYAFDAIPDMTPEAALTAAVAAIGTLAGVIESIRSLVYSPATVSRIVNTPPTAEGPIAAAEAEGVDTSQ